MCDTATGLGNGEKSSQFLEHNLKLCVIIRCELYVANIVIGKLMIRFCFGRKFANYVRIYFALHGWFYQCTTEYKNTHRKLAHLKARGCQQRQAKQNKKTVGTNCQSDSHR